MVAVVVVVVAAAIAGCGGGGKCGQPPCNAPTPSCDSDEDCFQSEFCDFQLDSCGRSVQDVGTCERRPTVCTGQVEFVCGCDGQTHTSPCIAATNGADVNNAGGCSAPPNGFACGSRFCDRTEQLCAETIFPGEEESSSFQCGPFPQECRSNRSCACIDPEGFLNCRETNGGFTIEQRVFPDPAEDV